MSTVEVLVGMIASGKSYYARNRAADGALVICHDTLTEMLHGSYRYEPGLRTCYRRMEEALVHIAIENGRDVVIDRTHLTRESRQRWVGYVKGSLFCVPVQPRIVAVVFSIESPEWHTRMRMAAGSRGRTYDEWLMVARHHAGQAQLDPISEDEGFSQIVRLPSYQGVDLE